MTDRWTTLPFSFAVRKLSRLSPPDLMGFLHSSLGVLTSSQHYISLQLAKEIYNAQPSHEYGSLPSLTPPSSHSSLRSSHSRLHPLPLTYSLLAIYTSLKDSTELSPATARLRAHRAVHTLFTSTSLTISYLDYLPISVSAPIWEAVRTVQMSPPSLSERGSGSWEAWMLANIGREDLARMASDEDFGGSEGGGWLGAGSAKWGGHTRINEVHPIFFASRRFLTFLHLTNAVSLSSTRPSTSYLSMHEPLLGLDLLSRLIRIPPVPTFPLCGSRTIRGSRKLRLS